MHQKGLAGKTAARPEQRQAPVSRRVDPQGLGRSGEVPGHPGPVRGAGPRAYPFLELLRHPGQTLDQFSAEPDDPRIDGPRRHVLHRPGHELVDLRHLGDEGEALGREGRGFELHLALGVSQGLALVLDHLGDEVGEPLQNRLGVGQGLALFMVHHQNAADHAAHQHGDGQERADVHRRLVVGQGPEQGSKIGGVEGAPALEHETHGVGVEGQDRVVPDLVGSVLGPEERPAPRMIDVEEQGGVSLVHSSRELEKRRERPGQVGRTIEVSQGSRFLAHLPEGGALLAPDRTPERLVGIDLGPEEIGALSHLRDDLAQLDASGLDPGEGEAGGEAGSAQAQKRGKEIRGRGRTRGRGQEQALRQAEGHRPAQRFRTAHEDDQSHEREPDRGQRGQNGYAQADEERHQKMLGRVGHPRRFGKGDHQKGCEQGAGGDEDEDRPKSGGDLQPGNERDDQEQGREKQGQQPQAPSDGGDFRALGGGAVHRCAGLIAAYSSSGPRTRA